jgi:hypothetical protein
MKSFAQSINFLGIEVAGEEEIHLIHGFNSPIDSTTLSTSKSQSQSYLDKGSLNSPQVKKKSRSDGFKARQEVKRHLALLAKEINELELSERLLRCHSRVGFLTCGRHICRIIPNYVCGFKLCPDCARRKSRKRLNEYLPVMSAFVKTHRVEPVHLVLTQTHKKETRKQSLKRLKNAFNNLIRREFWKEHFKGGTWSIEFTKDAEGLHHTHLHIIGFRTKFFNINWLREEWFSATGDSYVLHLDRVTELSKGLQEVFKYVTKGMATDDFTAEDLKDFLNLRNVRLFSSFGEFRKFKKDYIVSDDDKDCLPDYHKNSQLVEGCICPSDNCGGILFDKRASATGFIKYLKKIEDYAPS